MSGKTNRNSVNTARNSLNVQSKTPGKFIKKQLSMKNESDSTISTNRTKYSRDYSVEPLRMAINLEDIIKTSKKSGTTSRLKPELIEPEIEASIPCIEYIPKSIQPAMSNYRPISPVENNKIRGKNTNNDAVEFSFEKMNADCKELEENIIFEKNKLILEEIEKAIGNKFNCKVKITPERNSKQLPSTVIIKLGENIEFFSISKS